MLSWTAQPPDLLSANTRVEAPRVRSAVARTMLPRMSVVQLINVSYYSFLALAHVPR